MSIKNVRKGLNNTGVKPVTRKPIVKEPIEEEIDFEEEFEEEIDLGEIEEFEDVNEVEEEIEEEQPTVKKASPIASKKKENISVKPLNNIPKEASVKKKLGGSKPKKEKSNGIGNVFPIEKLVENIQNALDERFEGITKKDAEIILRVVENEIYNAASQSTVRLFGGTMKAKKKAPSITSPGEAKLSYYKSERYELALEGCIISEFENYAGYKDPDNEVFVAQYIKNKKTKEYEPLDKELEFSLKTEKKKK